MKKKVVILLTVLVILATTGAALAADGGTLRVTTLSGSEVVPPADPDGSGFASVRLNYGQGRVCWKVSHADIGEPTAAHIHEAPFGTNGGVVVALSPGSGCLDGVDQGLIKDIVQNPGKYYVQVHNEEYPGGVLRGQLSNPGQSE
jgi:hypothetical protein